MQNTFKQLFEEQLLKSERFRALLLTIILGILVAFGIFNYFFLNEFFNKVFTDVKAFLWGMFVGLFLVLRSAGLYFFCDYRIKNDKGLFKPLHYSNSFFESTIPTIVLIIFAEGVDSRMAFITPAVFLYFIFVFMSVLELNPKISIYTGVFAGLQYVGITLFYQNHFPESVDMTILNSQAFYIVVGIIIAMTGIVAGMVAGRIKKQIFESFKNLDERNKIEKMFGQQVSPKIVNVLLNSTESLISKESSVCVMFLDIRGFTPFCEGKTPEEIIRYQNALFPFMIDIINKNNGTIHQFMGDGFMATFGVPLNDNKDCENAVKASTEIVNAINNRNEAKAIPETRIGIGLHFGKVVTGNVGTESRMQYSITGNTVILAARIEQLNKQFHSSLLISKEVAENLHTNKDNMLSLGPVDLKGRTKPVEVFKLI